MNKVLNTKSYFAVINGECKKFDIQNKSIEKITTKINLSELLQILKVLNRLFCLTLEQISSILKISMNEVKEKISELCKEGFIEKCDVLNKSNKKVFEFYFLSKVGKEFLIKYKIDIKDFVIRKKTLIELKKILEWNELFINFYKSGYKIEGYNNELRIFSDYYNNNIKVSGGYIKFNNNMKYIFEIIRNEKDMILKLKRRLIRYYEFLNNTNNDKKIKIVFVCEDDKQVMNIINVLNNKELDKNIFFTTDKRIYNYQLLSLEFNKLEQKYFLKKLYIEK